LSPERTPTTRPVLDDDLRGGRLGEDVRAALLGLRLLVAGQRGDRDDLVAVVLERRRRRDPELGLAAGQHVDRFLLDLAEREALLRQSSRGQVGEEVLQGLRAHDGAREVVAATGLGLLDDRDRDLAEALHRLRVVAEQLQQPVGTRQPGRAAAHDGDADLDELVLVVEAVLDELLPGVDRRREVRRGDRAHRCGGR
jgi:hypothetical protein